MKIDSIFLRKNNFEWYRKLSIFDKRLLWGFLGLVILILMIIMSIETFRNLNSDIPLYECNQLRIDDVRYYLSLQEDNKILAFIYAFATPIKFMLVAIGIAWILHGVGFHIIKR